MATIEDKLDALSVQMTSILQMMEEANAGMCRTLRTSTAASRSSAPSSSPVPPTSSAPTTAPTPAAPSSSTARTAAAAPTTISMLGVIDEYALKLSAGCNHAAPTAVTTAPTPTDSDAPLNAGQKLIIPLPGVCFSTDDPECADNDLAPPHQAMASRFHLVHPSGVPEALRWFVSDVRVNFVGLGSAHDYHIQEQHTTMVVLMEEDGVSSTLPNRCLMNCLTNIQSCFPSPFCCSLDALLCGQYSPWPPPSNLHWANCDCEAELRPLPWPSFDMVERIAVTSLSVHLWKPPWYVSNQQHTNCDFPELVELCKCLMRLERIVVILVLLGICQLKSGVMTASMLSKLKLVNHGNHSDSGISSVHTRVNPTGWNSRTSKNHLETIQMPDGLVILLGDSMVVHSEALHTSSSNESIPYWWTIIAVLHTLKLMWYTTCTCYIELKPWPNWHGHQGSLIVQLIYPHLSIVIWVQFSCSVCNILVCSVRCESWWECVADYVQLLVRARQVDYIIVEAIVLTQLLAF